VRDTENNRVRFADTLAVVLLRYWSLHKALDWTTCQTASGLEDGSAPGAGPGSVPGNRPDGSPVADLLLYPNPLPKATRTLRLNSAVPEAAFFQVFDAGGRAVAAGRVRQGELLLPLDLPAELYAVLLADTHGFWGRGRFAVE